MKIMVYKGPEQTNPDHVQPKGVNWEVFPKITGLVLQGVLEEISVSRIDRDPNKTRAIHKSVLDQLRWLSYFRHLTNQKIANHFRSSAHEAISNGNIALAEEYRLIRGMVSSLARVKNQKP